MKSNKTNQLNDFFNKNKVVKSFRGAVLLSSMVLFSSAAVAGTEHRVEPNENLTFIAKKYGVTVANLIDFNGLDASTIMVGQVVKIPDAEDIEAINMANQIMKEADQSTASTTRVTNTTTDYVNYRVQAGDNLSKIAQMYPDVGVVDIMDFNGLDSDMVRINQTLKIPTSHTASPLKTNSSSTTSTNTIDSNTISTVLQRQETDYKYRIQRSDTLSTMAAKLGMPVYVLANANGVPTNHRVVYGKVYTIPGMQSYRQEIANSGLENSISHNAVNATQTPATYRVQAGDGLISVARKFNVDVKELAEINNMTDYDYLKIGQEIKLPIPTINRFN